MPCAPLRILCNQQNLIRTATLAPSSVKPAENTVIPIAAARTGSGTVELSGAYTGAENATLDIEIVDLAVVTKLPSAPTFYGVGSGTLTAIDASGFAAQRVTVELKDAGIPILFAKLDFEGVKIVARNTGSVGNNISINIDQSTLSFAAQDFSLLSDLKAGAGGPTSGLTGSGYEWDTAVMGDDGVIPSTAHRIAFGDDASAIYLAYKQYVDNVWRYHFVPALLRDVARGTVIKFVTGGRAVTITDTTTMTPTVETYADIESVYDLLHAVRETSDLVTVEGVVAFDRTPSGQAARELLARTDAHVEPSYGSGSHYATGFTAAFADSGAATELITATCFANTPKDHPLARLGAERWEVKSSLRGTLAAAITGVAYVGDTFGFLIPPKFPPGFGGVQKGTFSLVSIVYEVRNPNEAEAPPICMVLAPLGPNAVDQTITLKYAHRPSGTCNCEDMPKPRFDASCLGTNDQGAGDGTMSYSAANRARIVDLRSWMTDLVFDQSTNGYDGGQVNDQGNYDQAPLIAKPITRHVLTQFRDDEVYPLTETLVVTTPPGTGTKTQSYGPLITDGGGVLSTSRPYYSYTPFDTESLIAMVDRFELALAQIDALTAGTESPDPKEQGETAWDAAVAKLKADVEAQLGVLDYSIFGTDVPDPEAGIEVEASEALVGGDVVLVYRLAGTPGTLRVRKWVPGIAGALGFVKADAAGSPLTATVYFAGLNSAAQPGSFTPGTFYSASTTTPGQYVATATSGPPPYYTAGPATTASEINHMVVYAGLSTSGAGALNRLAILADRYRENLKLVLSTAGIAPKSDASILESGDGCWRDSGDAMWWEVSGSAGGGYAPAFSNQPYYASRRAEENGKYYSTHEFGFRINVKCPERLKAGDTITLAIGSAVWSPTYQIGDELVLPIVAGADLRLAGGQDGNDVQQWNVTGSVAGPLPVYSLNIDAPTAYSSGGLSFLITPGAIAFALGDKFTFALEGGHFKWRVNTGMWNVSSPLDAIPVGPVLLYEGLSATFATGNASSFSPGDRYSFRLLQPRAASNLQTPGVEVWQWDGDDPEFVFDLGSVEDVANLALALHTLPDGCTITVDGSVALGSPFTPDWTETLVWREGPIYKQLATVQSARYLRLTINDAPDAMIGWFFAGPAVMTTLSADLELSKAWKLNRGAGGLFGGGRYLAKAVNGSVEWTEGALLEGDVEKLEAMLDYSKANGDEPILIVPNYTRPEKAFLGRIAVDEVNFPDVFSYQPMAGKSQRLSARFALAGVYF